MKKRFLQRENTRMYHVWLRSFMVCLCLALAGVSAWGQGETMEINDADDLYEFAKRVHDGEKTLNASLMNDITVNETLLNPGYVPDMHNDEIWGGNEKKIGIYKGTFDGNGFAIKGLYIIAKAFIEELEEGGKIINLRIEDSYVKPQHVGTVHFNAAILCGENKGVIENCYTNSKLIIEGEGSDNPRSYGSICGENFGIIRNCHNEGSIDVNLGMGGGGISVGGICGKMAGDEGGENGLLEKCYNKGSMLIETKREKSDNPINPCIEVGGVVGTVGKVDRNPTQNQTVQYCYNEGEINISSGDDLSHYYPIVAGGIIGSSVSNKNIISCYNTGEIIAHDDITLEKESDMSPVYCALSGIVASGSVKGLEGCYNLGDFTNKVKGGNTNASVDLFVISGNNYSVVKNFYKGNYAAGNMTLSFEGNTINLIYENLDNVEGATKITDEILESGEMAWALRDYGYGLELPNATKAYPTLRCFDKNLPAVYQLKLHQNETETIQYCNSGNLNLPKVAENFGWFDSEGKEYFNNSEITNDLELTIIEKKKYTVTVKVAEGYEDMGTVTGSDQYDKGTEVTITATPKEGYEFKSWTVESENVTLVDASQATTTFTMPENDVTVTATFTEKEDPTDPEEPVDPPVVDPTNYYNIYNETTYDFIDVSFSRNVVREGGSVNVYLEIPEGLDPAAVTLMFKRSLYGGWENLNTDDDGNYLINNIWTDIYVKAVVDESYIDPNPDENHIYIDLSETNDSIWLYTDHKLVEEGKTAVIQAEVAKSCQNKEIRYMYKRTVLGEWKEMPKDYSINQYVVRDITTDIYVKAYFVFDKQDPTTAKNPHHVYADITATCEGLYLDVTRHKVADEGDTKVFLYVKKGFETKDARYLFKRGLKGEWEDLVPGIEQNTFQVTDIESDIYLKGIDAVYTGTEDIDGMVRVYTKDGSLFVYTAQPEEISVVSMTGVTVKRTRQTGLQSYPLNQGIYVVCVGEQVFKVRVK